MTQKARLVTRGAKGGGGERNTGCDNGGGVTNGNKGHQGTISEGGKKHEGQTHPTEKRETKTTRVKGNYYITQRQKRGSTRY